MSPFNTMDVRSTDLCTTPACIKIAAEVLSNLAINYTDIDPCTDFDKFACGNWASRHQIPAGRTATDSLINTGENTYMAVRQIIEGPYPSGPEAGWITVNLSDDQSKADKRIFTRLQETYQICINYTAQENEDLELLAKFVGQIVDAFPVTESSSEKPQDHSAAVGKALVLFESLGISTFQRTLRLQNVYNPEEVIVMFSPPEPTIPTVKSALPQYKQLASELISAVHPDNMTVTHASTLIDSVVDLEIKLYLAKQAAAAEDANDTLPNYRPTMSLAEVQKLAPQLNYEYVFGQLAPEGYKADKLAVPYPKYYSNISQIISETSAETLQAFFVWKGIAWLSPYVESKLAYEYNFFERELNGQDLENIEPRWHQCISLLDNGAGWTQASPEGVAYPPTGLTWILSRFFVDRYLPLKAKDLTGEIVDYLKNSFLERIKTREWATSKVKDASADKLHAIVDQIGLPAQPDAVDPTALESYYANYEVTDSHLINVLAMAKTTLANDWASLGKPYNRDLFSSGNLVPNAYYNPPTNQITLLAGIQQFPIYDADFPTYMVYGGMGSIVGHEITHGFDSSGRLYDKTGNYTTWWDEESIAAFQNKTECFIEQYGKFTITAPDGTQVPVDGANTLNENIADAGGVVSSFAAWKKWEADKGKGKSLPGLDKFTHEQLFFLMWGQAWCDITPPIDALSALSSDVHSPGAARIKLVLDNSPDFKEAYNCPKKEPVCELW